MRVKNGSQTRQRRKSVKKQVAGAWGTKHTSFKIAKQTLLRSSDYAYRDRRRKKRDFRKMWNLRINAAIKPLGYNYSTFICKLHKNNVIINRKMLSELAINEPESFKNLVEQVMKK